MKSFTAYLEEKKVRKISPDPAEADSLLKQSEARLKDLKNLPLSEETAPFRFESAYEVLREVLQSFLAAAGYKPYSHEAILAFGKEQGILSLSEFERSDRYRQIRNDINYRGKTVLKIEAEEIILFVSMLLPKLKSRKA
ncbi:MAG: hypothetical protein GXP63_04770 [DPANN group archaeon]|nr:hypothetical protein [DPANN group archaeon]